MEQGAKIILTDIACVSTNAFLGLCLSWKDSSICLMQCEQLVRISSKGESCYMEQEVSQTLFWKGWRSASASHAWHNGLMVGCYHRAFGMSEAHPLEWIERTRPRFSFLFLRRGLSILPLWTACRRARKLLIIFFSAKKFFLNCWEEFLLCEKEDRCCTTG